MVDTIKRRIKKCKIIETITVSGPISRIDIARLTGISPAITGSLVNELIAAGAVEEVGETGPSAPGSGHPRTLLATVTHQRYYIGTELSERAFTFSLTDNTGIPIKHRTITLCGAGGDPRINASFYMRQLNQFIQDCAAYQPRAIGFAIPGHYTPNSQRIASNNPLWLGFNLPFVLKQLELPVYIANNVHCMAMHERLANKDYPDENFIFFHIGRGMFCAEVENGRVAHPNNFLIGEVGHTIVNPFGEFCDCGRRGCLQTYASEGALIKKAQLLFAQCNQTYLHQIVDNPEQITIETLLQAYQMGDEGILNMMDLAMHYLAQSLNNISTMMDAKHIVLHGQIFAFPNLVTMLKQYIHQNAFLINGAVAQPIGFTDYDILDGAVSAAALAAIRSEWE